MSPEITLEQWRALAAVVDHGGYARAAEALDKSQSTVSHHIQKLEGHLGTRVLRLQGRRAVLTDVGKMALRRARAVLIEAGEIEKAARTLASGVEAELNIAVDTIFPNQIILPAFGHFAEAFPYTRIEMHEVVITGITRLLEANEIDLAVTPWVPEGWIGDHLLNLDFICVAHPDHPLHHLGRPVTESDLRRYRQLVVRESDPRRETNPRGLVSEQRLTVSTLATRIQALCQGLGFAWSPRLKITRELDAGLLEPLPMERGATRVTSIYLMFADPQGAGPAALAMARCLRDQVALACREHARAEPVQY